VAARARAPASSARPPAWAASRRGFLRLAGSATALGALSQVRVAPVRADTAAPAGRFFDDGDTEILTQVMERIVDTGREDAPPLRETGAVATVDTLCLQLDPSISWPLPYLLRVFEWGPFFLDLHFSRFTRMSDAEKDASLRAWMNSRLELRRLAFLAVRNLCFVGFYSQEETWPLIDYKGPLL
jgi:hypothetical protein